MPNIFGAVDVYLYTDVTGVTKGTPETCDDGINSCVVSFTAGAASDYYLQVKFNQPPAYPDNPIVLASLSVTGSALTRTGPILKQTIAVGPYRFHNVFFSAATTLVVSLPFADSTQSDYYTQADFVAVYTEL